MKKSKPKHVRKEIGTCRNLTRLADMVREKFKIPCDKTHIKNWQRKEPPFPYPGPSNAYVVKDCFAWVKKHIMPNSGTPEKQVELDLMSRAQNSKYNKSIREDEREQLEFDKERGLYILLKEAEQTIRATMQQYHEFVKTHMEQLSPASRRDKLVELGVPTEIVSRFYEWDLTAAKAVIDRIEKKCEEQSK